MFIIYNCRINFYNENYKFPGINALYICLATGLLIYLNNENLIYKILSSSLVSVGKISYSLYLYIGQLLFYFIFSPCWTNIF